MLQCRFRRVATALVAGIALTSPAGAAAAVPSPVVAHATMHYYAVGGVSVEQIRARLDANAPTGPDGFNGDAYTTWAYRWSWPGYGTPTCDLARAVVSFRADVHFPRWTHPRAAPAAVASAWARYARALAVHESGHASYARSRSPFILLAIKGATCRTADAVAKAQLALIRRHDAAYDARTKHGATQGARFP